MSNFVALIAGSELIIEVSRGIPTCRPQSRTRIFGDGTGRARVQRSKYRRPESNSESGYTVAIQTDIPPIAHSRTGLQLTEFKGVEVVAQGRIELPTP